MSQFINDDEMSVSGWEDAEMQERQEIEAFQEEETFLGDDISVFNFRQNAEGRWIGMTSSDVYTTINTFSQGETPDRFKFEVYRKATEEESIFYWNSPRN